MSTEPRRIEILAVHKHDAWASNSRDFIGATGTANWVAKTPGIPDWFSMDFTPDSDELRELIDMKERSCIFFAVKFKEIPE